MQELFDTLNQKVQKLDWVDIALIKCATFFVTFIIVKLMPGLFWNTPLWLLVVLAVVSAVRPFYKAWIEK